MNTDLEFPRELFNEAFIPYVFDVDKPIELLFGSAGSSKTVHFAFKCVLRTWGGMNGLICRQEAVQLRDSVYADINKAINILGLGDYFKSYLSPMRIECDNGKVILFRGLDNVDKLKGLSVPDGEIDYIGIDELDRVFEDSINQLQFRSRGGGSRKTVEEIEMMKHEILSTESLEELQSADFLQNLFNVLGYDGLEEFTQKKKYFTGLWNPTDIHSWINKRFFHDSDGNCIFDLDKGDKVLETDDMYIMHSTHWDNQFLTEDDHIRYESYRFINLFFYNVYALGKWGVLGDLVCPHIKSVIISDGDIASFPKSSIRNGLDFGFIDEFAEVKLSIDKARRSIYIFDEIIESRLTTKAMIDRVLSFVGYGRVLCDSADRKSIEDLREAGINADGVHKYEGHKERGWIWLMGYHIYIDAERCPKTYACLSTYQWQKNKNGETIQKVQDGNDHAADAIIYALNEDIMMVNRKSIMY